MTAEPQVRHDAATGRFAISVDGHLAVADYALADERMIFTHTFVPPALRGRGLAEVLVRAGLAEARARGRRVVPQCSYVAAFLARHPEFRDLVADPDATP